MKPIPRNLLIHAASLQTAGTPDKWGKREPTTKELKYIRIEPSSKLVQDKENKQIQLSSTLFYDCRNSLPRGVEFIEEGQTVLFGSKKYEVKTIEPLYDGNKLHHYELGLV